MSRLRLSPFVALATLATLAACAPDDLPAEEEPVDAQAGALIGGAAVIKPLPYVGALGAFGQNNDFFRTCTVTMIAPDWALTAAHCVYNAQGANPFTLPKGASVCTNIVNLNDCKPAAAGVVKEAFVNPHWDGNFNHGSDAAVLHLDRPIATELVSLALPLTVSPLPQPVPVPETPPQPTLAGGSAQPTQGTSSLSLAPIATATPVAPIAAVVLPPLPETVTVLGFGWTSATSTANRHLNQFSYAVLADSVTHKIWKTVQEQLLPPPLILQFPEGAWASMFGTAATATMSACKGDSGGPAFNSAGVQVGIVSAGDPYCSGLVPDLNTEVRAISSWALTCATSKIGCSISVPVP